jgi:Protein of unknown function (DUF3574)
MLDVLRSAFSVLVLVVTTLTPGQAEARQAPDQILAQDRPVIQRQIPKEGRTRSLPFVRTELYFGTAKPDGVVTEEQFKQFVDEYVTPRFPDGLTVLKGDGQFRGASGVIVKEQSFVLILLYPYEASADSSKRIERIRLLYKRYFDQESVLRVDDPFIVWVSF